MFLSVWVMFCFMFISITNNATTDISAQVFEWICACVSFWNKSRDGLFGGDYHEQTMPKCFSTSSEWVLVAPQSPTFIQEQLKQTNKDGEVANPEKMEFRDNSRPNIDFLFFSFFFFCVHPWTPISVVVAFSTFPLLTLLIVPISLGCLWSPHAFLWS